MRKLGVGGPHRLVLLLSFLTACSSAPNNTRPSEARPVGNRRPAEEIPPRNETADLRPVTSALIVTLPREQSVDLTVGDEIDVIVEANNTTPFQWQYDVMTGDGSLTFVRRNHASEPPKGCTQCVGYAGTDMFAFQAATAGNVMLRFRRVHLGQQAVSAEHIVRVSIRARAAN